MESRESRMSQSSDNFLVRGGDAPCSFRPASKDTVVPNFKLSNDARTTSIQGKMNQVQQVPVFDVKELETKPTRERQQCNFTSCTGTKFISRRFDPNLVHQRPFESVSNVPVPRQFPQNDIFSRNAQASCPGMPERYDYDRESNRNGIASGNVSEGNIFTHGQTFRRTDNYSPPHNLFTEPLENPGIGDLNENMENWNLFSNNEPQPRNLFHEQQGHAQPQDDQTELQGVMNSGPLGMDRGPRNSNLAAIINNHPARASNSFISNPQLSNAQALAKIGETIAEGMITGQREAMNEQLFHADLRAKGILPTEYVRDGYYTRVNTKSFKTPLEERIARLRKIAPWHPSETVVFQGSRKSIIRPSDYFDMIRNETPEFRQMRACYSRRENEILKRISTRSKTFSYVKTNDSPYIRWTQLTDLGRSIELRNLFEQFCRSFLNQFPDSWEQIHRMLWLINSEWEILNVRGENFITTDPRHLERLKSDSIMIDSIKRELRTRPLFTCNEGTSGQIEADSMLREEYAAKTAVVQSRLKKANETYKKHN